MTDDHHDYPPLGDARLAHRTAGPDRSGLSAREPQWPDPALFVGGSRITYVPAEPGHAAGENALATGTGHSILGTPAPHRHARGQLYVTGERPAPGGWFTDQLQPEPQAEYAATTPEMGTGEPRPDLDRTRRSAASVMPDLRNKVVNRLHRLNINHAAHAWERRRRDPLNPNAIVFCYGEPPTGTPARRKLALAWRLLLGSDEHELPRLLRQLHPVVEATIGRREHPRTALTNSCEPMDNGTYVGVAVSVLGSADRPWSRVLKTAHSEIDIPGRCYAVLTDGSRLVIDRHADDRYGRVDVWSTALIRDCSGQTQRGWKAADTELEAEPGDTLTWIWLTQIHDLLLGPRDH